MIGFWSGLKSQENDKYILVEYLDSTKTYIIGNDTFAFIKISDIDKSMQKMLKVEIDSIIITELKTEIKNRDLLITELNNRYKLQLNKDSIQSQIYDKQVNLYKSLEKDYNKLLKDEKLKFAFGGKVNAYYSNTSKRIDDLSISLSPGLLFKRRYLLYTDFGISMGQKVNFGVGTFTIF